MSKCQDADHKAGVGTMECTEQAAYEVNLDGTVWQLCSHHKEYIQSRYPEFVTVKNLDG